MLLFLFLKKKNGLTRSATQPTFRIKYRHCMDSFFVKRTITLELELKKEF